MHVGSVVIGLVVSFAVFALLPAPKGCGCEARKASLLAMVTEVIGLA